MTKLEAILNSASNLYVLDLSWHLHRNYHVFDKMGINIDGYVRPTGHLYGVLSTIKMIKQHDSDAVIIITEDGVPQERIEALSGEEQTYKEGRAELDFNFYKDIPLLKAAACILPKVYWAFNEDKECDDLMYALAKQACKCTNFTGKCFIYSGDNDLLQAIDERISVIRNKSKDGFEEITNYTVQTDEKFVKKFHGVDTKHISNYRAICGDPSDKIKGIPRFPRDLAVKIAQSTESIMDGWTYCPQSETEKKWMDRLFEEIEIVRRNYKVMKLTDEFEVNLSKPSVKKENLYKTLDNMQLRSYIKYLNEML